MGIAPANIEQPASKPNFAKVIFIMVLFSFLFGNSLGESAGGL
jgi:hypothetical protein